ncbi:OmpA family protein [uncultured Lacinutrix sp.]|uniref:OmpA family protein n=1 Tax=uncultured Lacinutrix sp. TaxID=574032 RepID=UPI00260C0F0A|nr:OmpA family protein [uncultured Lacinutrix sp.]
MSKKTGYLLGILLTIIIGTLLYWFLCCKPCLEAKQAAIEAAAIEAAKPEVKAATKNAFSIIDTKSSIRFNSNDNFNFKASDFSILEPVSSDLTNKIERLSTYLKDNPGKTVDITGHYTSGEKNNTVFPNLGLARANSVKNYFVSHGMSSKDINTFGKLNDDLVPDENYIYYGPATYKIGTIDPDDTSAADALKQLGEEIKADPLVLYFDSGAASISLTANQREKVAKMVRYVDKVDTSISVIGHTDNTGNRDANIKLGKNRAEFVKTYLVQNGISANKISTSSKGPDKPIADNNTDEGKAKNRRVVVTIN